MKNLRWLALICALALNGAEARDVTPSPRHNLSVTRQYYSQLVADRQPRLAELTLFTNMLPKGGDLHHHYSGAIYVETYLDWVGAQDACIFRMTDTDLHIEKFKIAVKPQTLSNAARAQCLSVQAIRAEKDNFSFYRELLQHWSDKDYDNHFHTQPAPDQQFFETFNYFGPVAGYDYRLGLQSLKARAQTESVGYLETMLKSGPSTETPALAALLNNLNSNASARQIETAFAEAYDLLAQNTDTSAKQDAYVKSLEEAAAGLDDDSFKLRYQAYVSRNYSPDKVFSSLYSAFVAAGRSPLIVGVNIVGPENGYIAMRDYSLHMQMFAFLKKRFPAVKLSLHAGELTLGMVPPEGLRSHIREAVLVAGADRIGHGVDIAHESDAAGLLSLMRQRQIAVEINLTSNAFILGIANEAHPLRLYARHGVPFVISTDDAGVSRNNLSGEYLLYVSRYHPSYDQLKRTVYNSIRYSFLPETEKRVELRKLDRRFATFEARIASMPALPWPGSTRR